MYFSIRDSFTIFNFWNNSIQFFPLKLLVQINSFNIIKCYKTVSLCSWGTILKAGYMLLAFQAHLTIWVILLESTIWTAFMINFKLKLWQDDHIFEKLNSLSFPWVLQDILNFSPEQLKREKLDECIFVGDHVTYFSLSLSFPRFFPQKFKFPRVFPEIFTIFQIPWVFHVFQVCGHPVWGE